MYFQLSVTDPHPDPDLSWILGKHPTSRFSRSISSRDGVRVVSGRFQPDGSYAGEVVNDSVEFLSALRRHNAANYLDVTLHAVCPANLRGLATIFRSALHGKLDPGSQITEAQFCAQRRLSLEIGPFSRGRAQAAAIFDEAGLLAEVVDSSSLAAFTLRVTNPAPRPATSVTEFLQRAYLLSHYLTQRVGNRRDLADDQLERFVGLCAYWLPALPSRDRVVRELCGFRRGVVGTFKDRLVEATADAPLDSPGSAEDAAVDLVQDDADAAIAETNDAEGGAALAMELTAATTDEEALERRISLHERRHDLILAELTRDEASDPTRRAAPGQPPYRVIDMGCGGGELSLRILERLPQASVLAVDADLRSVVRARRRMWRCLPRRTRDDQALPRVRVSHANLAYPDLHEADLRPDALVLSEVIEHLDLPDRRRLLSLVVDVICPRLAILTTPNVEYNVRLGLPAGQYRHPDHRVEYTRRELDDEVVAGLAGAYDVEIRDVVDEDLQPSFVVVARRRPGAPAGGRRGDAARLYAPFHLDHANYTVSPRELRLGAASHVFRSNARDVFYLGPTIAPVDYDLRNPDYLEHPQACFDYYRARGVSQLIGEYKYMGSRAYVLALRDPDMASRLGVSGPIVVNARSGLPFFGAADRADALARIYADLQPRMKDLRIDLLALDAEVLPWVAKAGKMVDDLFRSPGETALLARSRPGSSWAPVAQNAQAFLDALGQFTAPGPLEVRPFHVLAHARLSSRGDALRDLRLGNYTSHYDQLDFIDGLAGDVVKPCAWHEVDLWSPSSVSRSIDLWHVYCGAGRGEGFVYKPAHRASFRGHDGYLRQPALKVRGREYLRLIYGIDYLEPSWFVRLRARDTRRKRVLAVQQQELAERLLLAFLHRSEAARLSYLAAFLGVDSVRMPTIDRTL